MFFTRFVLNIGYRAVYPFLPFIASDLGVSFQSAAEIVQVRNLAGLAAPLFGPLSDHYGRRAIMLIGLAISFLACLTIGFVGSFILSVIAIAVLNFGLSVYEPAQHAYIGDRVPYAERGRAISLTEVAWSAAALAGLPLFGIIVEFFGWRAGFVLVGISGFFVMALTRFGLPGESKDGTSMHGGVWIEAFVKIFHEPVAIGVLATSIIVLACNENLNIVYAEWMQSSFVMSAIALGSVAAAMGAAEFAGEFISSVYVDRIGKHRFVAITIVLAAAAYVLLPLMGRDALLSTIGLALAFFMFELMIVSMLPLITEVVPSARATLMSLNIAAVLFGRAVGSYSGPYLYLHQGFMVNGLVSGAGMLIALVLWLAVVRERA